MGTVPTLPIAGATRARNALTIMTDDPDPSRSNSPDIAIAVRSHSPLWRANLLDAPAVVERAARAALAEVKLSGAVEISFLLANDARMQRLNRDFRGQDKPTNVLSFPAEDSEGPDECGAGARLLGDVVFAFETLEREAAAQSKPLSDHLSHLAVHGVLHLLGYDHAVAAQADRMERLEARILAGLGIADPYKHAGKEVEGAR